MFLSPFATVYYSLIKINTCLFFIYYLVQNMSKHLNMHRGIKPDRLQCHICEKTLCSANALKVHVETIHEGKFLSLYCMFIAQVEGGGVGQGGHIGD